MCKCHIWLSVIALGIVGQKLVVDGAYVHALAITFVRTLCFSRVKLIYK